MDFDTDKTDLQHTRMSLHQKPIVGPTTFWKQSQSDLSVYRCYKINNRENELQLSWSNKTLLHNNILYTTPLSQK